MTTSAAHSLIRSTDTTSILPKSPWAAAAGSLSVLPADGPAGYTIVLAFNAGRTRANNAVLKLSADGQASIAVRNGSSGTVQLILDVSGYFAP